MWIVARCPYTCVLIIYIVLKFEITSKTPICQKYTNRRHSSTRTEILHKVSTRDKGPRSFLATSLHSRRSMLETKLLVYYENSTYQAWRQAKLVESHTTLWTTVLVNCKRCVESEWRIHPSITSSQTRNTLYCHNAIVQGWQNGEKVKQSRRRSHVRKIIDARHKWRKE